MKRFSVILLSLCLVFILYPLFRMHFDNNKGIFYKGSNAEYALVFGASIRGKGKLSQVLKKRVDDAILLYKMKKVKKLVFSGALYNQIKPGEPKAMRNYAVSRGVPSRDIILDERGDNTYSSIQFARRLLDGNNNRSIVYVSSQFHIPRIQLLSHMVGISHFKVFYSKREVKATNIFDKDVRREIAAFWVYVFFYPFYKLDHYFVNNKLL